MSNTEEIMDSTPLKNKSLLNQFGDYEDTTNMSGQDWDKRWKQDQTQFHMGKPHPMLEKHLKTLTNNKEHLRFYIPLCGKSLDMKWLCAKGHEVVGSEFSSKGCKEFFEENEIPFTVENLKGIEGQIYKAKDRKLTIYQCDYFQLTSKTIGQFDCIWDRGSLVAIPVTKRQEYANIITAMMTKDTRYLLDCFLVDNTQFGGPPFNCTQNDVTANFEKSCDVQQIDTRDAFTKWQESWGITSFIEEVYMLKLRS